MENQTNDDNGILTDGELTREREPGADDPYYEDEDFILVHTYGVGYRNTLRSEWDARFPPRQHVDDNLFGSGLSPEEKAEIKAREKQRELRYTIDLS